MHCYYLAHREKPGMLTPEAAETDRNATALLPLHRLGRSSLPWEDAAEKPHISCIGVFLVSTKK